MHASFALRAHTLKLTCYLANLSPSEAQGFLETILKVLVLVEGIGYGLTCYYTVVCLTHQVIVPTLFLTLYEPPELYFETTVAPSLPCA